MLNKPVLVPSSRVLSLVLIGVILAFFLALFNRAMPAVDARALKHYSEGAYRRSIEVLSGKLWLSPFENYLLARNWQELGEWKNALVYYQKIRPSDLKWEKAGPFFTDNHAYYYSQALMDAERSGTTNWPVPDVRSLSNVWAGVGVDSFAYDSVTGVYCHALWKARLYEQLTNGVFRGVTNSHSLFFSASARLALGDKAAAGDFFEYRSSRYFPLVAPELTNGIDESDMLSLTPGQAASAIQAFTDWSRYDTAAKILKMHYSVTGDYDFYVRNRAVLLHGQGKTAAAFAILQKHWDSGRVSDRTLGVYVGLLKRSGADTALFALLKNAVRNRPQYVEELIETAARQKRGRELLDWARTAGKNGIILRQEHKAAVFSALLRTDANLARLYAFTAGDQEGHYYLNYIRGLFHLREGNRKSAYREFLAVTLSAPLTYEWLVSREYERAMRGEYAEIYEPAVVIALKGWERLSENDRAAFYLGMAETDTNIFQQMTSNVRYAGSLSNVRAVVEETLSGQTPERREQIDWWRNASRDWVGGFNREILNEIDRGQTAEVPDDRYKTVYQNRDLLTRLSLEGPVVLRLNFFLSRLLGGRRYHPLLEESVFRDLYPVKELPRILAIEPDTNTALWILASFREESHFVTGALSRSGAVGIAQLMPKTGNIVKTNMKREYWSIRDREDNVAIGVTHFSYLFRRYGGSVNRALAAYNAGETVVNRWVKNYDLPPELWAEALEHSETRNYIKKIVLTRYYYDRIYGFPRPAGIFTGTNR